LKLAMYIDEDSDIPEETAMKPDSATTHNKPLHGMHLLSC